MKKIIFMILGATTLFSANAFAKDIVCQTDTVTFGLKLDDSMAKLKAIESSDETILNNLNVPVKWSSNGLRFTINNDTRTAKIIISLKQDKNASSDYATIYTGTSQILIKLPGKTSVNTSGNKAVATNCYSISRD